MRLDRRVLWSHIAAIVRGYADMQSYEINVGVFEGLSSGDRFSLQRDYNCYGLANLVNSAALENALVRYQANFTTVWIFDEDDPSDKLKFMKWPRDNMLGRFIDVEVSGSHGNQRHFVAMFRDDAISQSQAALFKLAEC